MNTEYMTNLEKEKRWKELTKEQQNQLKTTYYEQTTRTTSIMSTQSSHSMIKSFRTSAV